MADSETVTDDPSTADAELADTETVDTATADAEPADTETADIVTADIATADAAAAVDDTAEAVSADCIEESVSTDKCTNQDNDINTMPAAPSEDSSIFTFGDSLLLNPSSLANHALPSTDKMAAAYTSAHAQSIDEVVAGEEAGKVSAIDEPVTTYSDGCEAANGPGEESVSSKLQASNEFTLVEYDLSNYTHSVGRSRFYVYSGASAEVEASMMNARTPIQLQGAVQLSDKPKLFESLKG